MLSYLIGLGIVLPGVLADVTTTISSTTNWGTWEGFGVSLAWWAAAFGDRTDLADIFFTNKYTTLNGASIPGLWFNVARYNAGACSSNSINGQSMVVSPDMIASRQMEGFWLNGASTSATSSSWDWTVDAKQRNMLSMAASRGANKLELFSNSPMWWMCSNYNPSGSNGGSTDNIAAAYYDDHAIYLATIAQYASQHWGVNFASVEAFNEPSSSWWNGLTGTQEGCHIGATTQASIIANLRTELNSRGLSSVLVAASDENTYDLALTTWNTLAATSSASSVGRINVHGYQGSGGRRDLLYSAAVKAGKALWNTEYGESDATGSSLASNLILDFRWLHQTAWVYWQAIDGGGWGLITGDNDALTLSSPTQKYFVLAQFTRHIRPGMRILDGGSDYTVAAYDSSAKKLVIVAVNWGDAQYINFDLSGFSTPGVNGALVPRWSTHISSGNQYVPANDTYISGTKFWSYFDTNVVQSFEVSGVVL